MEALSRNEADGVTLPDWCHFCQFPLLLLSYLLGHRKGRPIQEISAIFTDFLFVDVHSLE